MRWLRWQKGRRNSGYDIFLLWEWPWLIPCDGYLLKFSRGSYARTHIDDVPGYRHYRVNFILKHAVMGGEFSCKHPIYIGKRLKIFRSDKPHQVGMIKSGTRWVLSIGVCFREKRRSSNV